MDEFHQLAKLAQFSQIFNLVFLPTLFTGQVNMLKWTALTGRSSSGRLSSLLRENEAWLSKKSGAHVEKTTRRVAEKKWFLMLTMFDPRQQLPFDLSCPGFTEEKRREKPTQMTQTFRHRFSHASVSVTLPLEEQAFCLASDQWNPIELPKKCNWMTKVSSIVIWHERMDLKSILLVLKNDSAKHYPIHHWSPALKHRTFWKL